jgi:uncharacterized protein (TIGR00255 family)
MIESMTGYGRASGKIGDKTLIAELKSVNSKFLEVRNHLSKDYADLDSKITAFFKKRFNRGSIDLYLNEEMKPSSKVDALIDFQKAKLFYAQAKKLARELKIRGDMDINTVLRYKELLSQGNGARQRVSFGKIEKLLARAADNLAKMRKREGRNLETDIKKRLVSFAAFLEKIDQNKDIHVEKIVERLSKRVEDIGGDIKFDTGRIEQEVVLYAAKADIAEEITRLKSHLKRMDEFLKASGACGRNLDFVLQEMNREVNTIGSKSQVSEISGCVVSMKGELEKIREQVQNIE